MRVSADAGWCDELKCSTTELACFLNDLKIDDAKACDTEEGWVDLLAKNSRGRPIVENGGFKIERRYGRVEVKRWKRKPK